MVSSFQRIGVPVWLTPLVVGLFAVAAGPAEPVHSTGGPPDRSAASGIAADAPAVCSQEWLAEARALAAADAVGGAVSAAPPDFRSGHVRPAAESQLALALQGFGGSAGEDGGRIASVSPPNDTYFITYQRSSLWRIGALDAWETTYGGPDVVVAIVSSGVDYRHEDLAGKIWRNRDEIPGNGIDDDRNGYVDDVMGYDFAEKDADPADFDYGVRGTMMAGIVAAQTNNEVGIAGVSWHAEIMPLKVLFEYEYVDVDGNKRKSARGEDEDAIEAVCYAANNGADVLLLGPILQFPEKVEATADRLRRAIAYAHSAGVVVVAPAGDCGGDPWADDRLWCPDPKRWGDSNNENPVIFPANYPHVIGVQSVDATLHLRPEASYGAWVDIAAPGEDFYTTATSDRYVPVRFYQPDIGGMLFVSDFAAAHVAGVAAAMRGVEPHRTPTQVHGDLCTQARKPEGVEFDQDVGAWTRNDHYGCGFLDFERTIEEMPWRVHDVEPTELRVITDGTRPALSHRFDNRHLNAGKWSIFTEEEWLHASGGPQGSTRASEVELVTDIQLLRQQTPRLVGMTFTSTLLACPVGSTNAGQRAYCDTAGDLRCPCQRIPYELRVVDHLRQVFLPQLLHR